MIVVLSVLAAVAVPRYFDYRERATASALAADFKSLANAAWSYVRDTGEWAPDAWYQFSPELLSYIGSEQRAGRSGTPLAPDTIYDWNGPPFVSPTGTLDSGPCFSVQTFDGTTGGYRWFTAAEWNTLQVVDTIIDDGVSTTGRVRNDFYYFNLP